MHAVFLTVMEELNNGVSPYVWVFIDSWMLANRLAIWSGRRAVETWPIKGMPLWGTGLWKFEGCIKGGHVSAHQKNSFPGLVSDWNQQADTPVCSLEMATWVHEMYGHRGHCSKVKMG